MNWGFYLAYYKIFRGLTFAFLFWPGLISSCHSLQAQKSADRRDHWHLCPAAVGSPQGLWKPRYFRLSGDFLKYCYKPVIHYLRRLRSGISDQVRTENGTSCTTASATPTATSTTSFSETTTSSRSAPSTT